MPRLWDAVRFEVDKRAESAQFILTGSAVPSDNVTAHTGTGRISRILMRPMSLFESKESNGTVSLNALFGGEQEVEAISDLSIEEMAFVLCRGGWLASVAQKGPAALCMAIDYVETVINYDVSQVDGVEKNPTRVRLLLRSLARNITTTANYKTIKDDVHATLEYIHKQTMVMFFIIVIKVDWKPI